MPAEAKTPDWVKDAVFYEIFPDRFASSEHVPKPANLEPWDAPPTTHGFKGGDLVGIAEHLDYLRDLGITAIYLTPVFQSAANHRYHTHDYYQVDPILGGNVAFKALLDAAHARDMRVILDGVFNHASRGFYQFHHALENGAASPYIDWFTFNSFPVQAYGGKPNYKAWWDLAALPKLNHANPQVRSFIFDIAEHWIREGIDGWRLDVPDEIDDDAFWQEFRERVKAINPDAYIVGEIWKRADRWLKGDEFDAVMNYQFARACLSFFVSFDKPSLALLQPQSYGSVHPINATAFAHEIEEQLHWYPWEIALSQLNLLDSHDTARFLTIARGDAAAFKLALLMMFTYVGPPLLYYGDEIGLEGRKDPDSRRAMPWDRAAWNMDILATAKNLIALREKYPALRRGGFRNLHTHRDVYAFARHEPDQVVIVALNAGAAAATFDLVLGSLAPGEGYLQEEWTLERTPVKDGRANGIHLPARTGRVWIAKIR